MKNLAFPLNSQNLPSLRTTAENKSAASANRKRNGLLTLGYRGSVAWLSVIVTLAVGLARNARGGDCNPGGPGRCYQFYGINMTCNGHTSPIPSSGTSVTVSWWTDWFCQPGAFYASGVDDYPGTSPQLYFNCHGLGGMDTYVTAISATMPDGSTYSGTYGGYNQIVTLSCDNPPPPPTTSSNKPNDTKVGGDGGGCVGMARYRAHAMLASLNIEDTPLRYVPPRGLPIDFTVTYCQRDAQQPATFSYSNLGAKWNFNWLSYVTDDPVITSADTVVHVPGGGTEGYSGYNSASQSFAPDAQSHAVLVRTSSTSYEKRFPDGSKQVFSLSDSASAYPRNIFMTQWVDPVGNTVAIGYDASFRITSVTDALGQVTTLSYALASDPLKITNVTDPFGRFATFTYTNGQLTKITDQIGIQSQFAYATGGDFINSLTTPYGTSNFASGESGTNKWLEMTDPLGGKERVEYRDNGPGISSSDPNGTVPSGFTNSGLDVVNTFFWDKKATEMYPPVSGVYDYTKAHITHWALNPDYYTTGITASEKAPLENRVWHVYPGQSDNNYTGSSANPSKIVRVLDDGTTQVRSFEYNSLGNVTKSTDPIGRVLSFDYDTNLIDLLRVRQTTGSNNELLRTLTYNSQHEPLTDTDAAGQTTHYAYNSNGQLLTVQNAKGETTTYSYGGAVPASYLASITSPPVGGSSAVIRFTYDSVGRVRTITNPDNDTITTDYDNLDRPTKITYPDGTYQQLQYTDNNTGAMTLDLTGTRDRRGRWTYRHYNANRQMDSTTDPLGRTTLYDWCSCGSLGSITDPRGKVTSFIRDLQGRVIQKIFADNTSISYRFENSTGRLKSLTDALGQTTNYSYFADNNLSVVNYTNVLYATPAVGFTYDPNYDRVATMTDGSGTTSYAYYPITSPAALGAGQLKSVDGPLSNDTIVYSYDELSRVTTSSVNGVTSTVAFDAVSRVSSEDNTLGHFSRTYDGLTARLTKLTYPNGQVTNYAYFDSSHDRRMQTLQNVGKNGVNLSAFGYTYDAEGQIQSITKQLVTTVGPATNYSYDLADQLTGASTLTSNSGYGYDLSGNRTTDHPDTPPHTFNDVNELTDSGYTYDTNGNLTADGTSTYEWDAANRLVAVQTTEKIPSAIPASTPISVRKRTEFSYDGLGRRNRITEKEGTGNTVQAWVTLFDNRYLWSGDTLAEERDTIGATVTKRFFPEGEEIRTGLTTAVVGYQSGGTNYYYYTRDHLGSVRELTDSSGYVHAVYDYDPFGVQSKISGDVDSDFGFTGHYHHAKSGLNLTLYRAYNPNIGRWLSRDPLKRAETNQGPNLYTYTGNNPQNLIDVLGLAGVAPTPAQQAQIDNALLAMRSLTTVHSISGYYSSLTTKQILVDDSLASSRDGATVPGSEPNVIRVSPRLFAFGELPVGSSGEPGNILLIVTLIHEDIHLLNYDNSVFGVLYNFLTGNWAGQQDHEFLEGPGGLDSINENILADLAMRNINLLRCPNR